MLIYQCTNALKRWIKKVKELWRRCVWWWGECWWPRCRCAYWWAVPGQKGRSIGASGTLLMNWKASFTFWPFKIWFPDITHLLPFPAATPPNTNSNIPLKLILSTRGFIVNKANHPINKQHIIFIFLNFSTRIELNTMANMELQTHPL